MMVNINKLMKIWAPINLFGDQDIGTCIEEVMTINEEDELKEIPLDEPTKELKPLPSTLKYAFLDS